MNELFVSWACIWAAMMAKEHEVTMRPYTLHSLSDQSRSHLSYSLPDSQHYYHKNDTYMY